MKPRKPLPPEVEAEIEAYRASLAPRKSPSVHVPLAVKIPAIVGLVICCAGLPMLIVPGWGFVIGAAVIVLAVVGLIALLNR
jgi:hypothetical protein